MTLILILKALLIALAGLLALGIILATAFVLCAAWAARGDYSIGADADASGLCDCPDCVNHSGTGIDCHAPAPTTRLREPHSTCAARTSLLPTPNS